MAEETRLEELLSLWQERWRHGEDPAATDLCRDCPELADALQQRIGALRQMDRLVTPTAATVACATPAPQETLAGPGVPGARLPQLSGYEILGELGRGGMGVVYKARQRSLNRLVALKMILAGGHAGQEQLARFRTEAEAIARLRHPNIVQIYEVGEAEGRPYLALEFLAGGSLDGKLRGTPLPPQEAARLVEVLARGMHAAHQARVIHRDLKPGNVLLAEDGTPRITDFGLAKKLDEAGQTHSGAIMGTPSYMAPEQAGGPSKDIGPAADIYALGAILYECLTGRPPFKAATSLDTVMQVVNDEPVPPRRLHPQTPCDLETVCLKCLHKEPGRRYHDAAALAEDLRRFQAGEPVLARPVGPAERCWRLCRRNPAVAAMSAASLVLLLGSLVAMTCLYLNAQGHRAHAEAERRLAVSERAQADLQRRRADEEAAAAKTQKQAAEAQRSLAREEADRSRQVTRFLVGLFEASDPLGLNGFVGGLVNRTGEEVTARALLDRGVRGIALNPQTQPRVRAAILDTVGTVYRSQGRHAEAEKLLEEALALRRTANAPPGEVAASLHSLAWLNHERGNYRKAVNLYEEALRLRRGEPDRDEAALANSQLNLGWVFTEMERYDEAEKLFREVIARRQKLFGPEHRETALAKMALAGLLLETGRFGEAYPWASQAMRAFRKLGEDRNILEAATKFQQGVLQSTLSRNSAGAEKLLREALRLVQTSPGLGPKHIYATLPLVQLAFTLEARGKFGAAEELFRQALTIAREKVGLAHPKAIIPAEGLARLARRRGQGQEGDAIFEEVLAAHQKRFGPADPFVADVLVEYADHLYHRKQLAREEGLLQAALTIYRTAGGVPRRRFIQCLTALGLTRLRAGKYAESEPYFRDVLARARQRHTKPHATLVMAMENLADARIRQGRCTPDVDALLTEGERMLPALSARDRKAVQPNLVISRCNFLRLEGKYAEVAALLRAYCPQMPAEAWLAEEFAFQYAHCLALVQKAKDRPSDEKARLSERYGAEAVALLRRAWRQGIANPRRWQTLPVLLPLRGRADYEQLLAEVRKT